MDCAARIVKPVMPANADAASIFCNSWFGNRGWPTCPKATRTLKNWHPPLEIVVPEV